MRARIVLPTLALLIVSAASGAWGQQGFKIPPVFKASKTLTGQNLRRRIALHRDDP